MAINKREIVKLSRLLGTKEAIHYYQLAKTQEKLEQKWVKKLKDLQVYVEKVVEHFLLANGDLPPDETLQAIFDEFFADHGADVFEQTMRVTAKRKPAVALAKGSPSLKALMDRWDKWRKRSVIPKAQQAQATKVKKDYLGRLKEAWKTYSRDFMEGDSGSKEKIIEQIKKESKAPWSRAKNIVETETTSGQNQARVAIYDGMDEVTHYLSVSIRDTRTSAWCTWKTTSKGRGRDMLVYRKGTALCEQDRPARHWYCRAEYLPLTPHNPKHLKLIKDPSRDASKLKLVPLPPGWNK